MAGRADEDSEDHQPARLVAAESMPTTGIQTMIAMPPGKRTRPLNIAVSPSRSRGTIGRMAVEP